MQLSKHIITWHLFCVKDDDISPLEEALTSQVVHQLRDKGASYTGWGKA